MYDTWRGMAMPETGLDFFADDCGAARERFLDACASRAGVTVEALPCPAAGPGGEPLFTDVAWVGEAGAGNLLLVMSGTHGVEGLAGSALQCAFLSALGRLPVGTAVCLVHLLNPWGTAWLRRCDQDGIDLNRNMVDFDAPLPENPGYRQLRPALLAEPEVRGRALADFARRDGQQALELAVSGGQYGDPAGPFYGGTAPSHGRVLLERLIREHRLAERRLAVVDIHTGLGPFGYGELICDHAPESAGTVTARRWYGEGVALPLAGTSFSVPKSGLIDFAFHPLMDEDGCFVTLEFGTYPTQELLDVVIDDHRRWGRGEHSPTCAAAMRRHFYPRDRSWREMVLWRGQQVLHQALAGLAAA
jgi:predicted deacylase